MTGLVNCKLRLQKPNCGTVARQSKINGSLAQRGAVTLPEDGEELSAVVRSGNNIYQVDTRLLTCPCADYQKHLQACKHLLAAEIHLGALGLVPPSTPEPAAAEEPAPVQDPAPMAPAPSTASWPISEAPASLNIKLRVGNMELMYVRPVQTELAQTR